MNKLRQLVLLLVFALALPVAAQNVYISAEPCVEENGPEESLDGKGGVLIITEHTDLIINVTNATMHYDVRYNNKRPDGLHEYIVELNLDDTRYPKLEIRRRGNIYTTEITPTVKHPNQLVAYRLVEVANPIRYEDVKRPNDTSLSKIESDIEITTLIPGLKVDYSPRLGATLTRRVDKKDGRVTFNLRVPFKVIDDARSLVARLDSLYKVCDANLKSEDEDTFKALDSVQSKKMEAEQLYAELITIQVYAEGTNRLSIPGMDELGPQVKKCYGVLPLTIEKEVFVTEYSSFMSQAADLFGQRKYKDARVAYVNAFSAKDIPANMKATVQASVAQCDSCILYDNNAGGCLNKIIELKKSGNASQDEVAKYASSAIDFLNILKGYNPDPVYDERIAIMEKLIAKLPLVFRFNVVEWLTLEEGKPLAGVEIWAYTGISAPSNDDLSSERKFERLVRDESNKYQLLTTTNAQGVAEVELDRNNQPQGIVFRAPDVKHTPIKFMNMKQLMRQSKSDYMKRQIRLRMFTKQ